MSGRQAIRRVVQVHTRYRQAGGEDRVVAAERGLLEGAGIAVEQVMFDNADLDEGRSRVGDLRLAASAVWSRSAQRRVRAALDRHRPQVVHVHNTFAAASPSVYAAAVSAGVPIVQTLHNYRLVCPAATAFRDGRPCTDCVGRRIALPAVIHTCVRGSRAQSAVVAATLTVHRGTFRRRVDTYVALTSFQRQLMVEGGLPSERIEVIPNFLEPDPGVDPALRAGVLFVGRLSEEKGVHSLLAAAERMPGILRVAGDGPLAPEVEEAAERGNLTYLGPLDSAAVLDELRDAVAIVVPSIWFEGFPMVVVEAYATATPVIASRIGSLAAVVDDAVTGLLTEPGNAAHLAERMRWAVDHPDEMRELGAAGRRRYDARYRGATHLAALLDTYRAAIARSTRRAHA